MPTFPINVPARDLLDDWYARVRLQNSVFALERSINVPEASVEQLRDTLSRFFGKEYFKQKAIRIKQLQLTDENTRWVYQLLVNEEYTSLVYLYELGKLLESSEVHHPALFKVLKATKGSPNFRDYLFEAVIHELLVINNIEYESKPIVNGKEREGFIVLDGVKCLFECKKLYSYQLPAISFLMSIQKEFSRIWQKYQIGLNGYISVEPGTAQTFSRNKYHFIQGIDRYLDHAVKTGQIDFEEVLINDKNKKIGNLLFEPSNTSIFQHQVELIQGLAFCINVQPAIRKMHDGKMMNYHQTQVQLKFGQLESSSIKYLVEQIRKKRKSQRDLSKMPRIFFFDNEIIRGLEVPMFPDFERFPGDLIQRYLDSKETNDIVVIVFRYYLYSNLPRWRLKVYCKSSLNPFKSVIEGWKTLYQDKEFLTSIPCKILS